MGFLALILWAVMSGQTVIEYGKQPLDIGLVAQESTPKIQHLWYSSDNERQAMVQRAYELWWLDFVLMLECENGNWNIKAVGDWGHAFGLCQVNDRFHKIPAEYYDSWEYQLDYCYYKWSTWTKFYGPQRKIKWMACRDYVRDRFIIND